MDTETFFDTILPEEDGWRCLVTIEAKRATPHYFKDNASMAAAVARLDAMGGMSVYHGCATYKSDEKRTQDNVKGVKAFWVDVDVGPDNPGKYPTLADAVRAAHDFGTKLGLPHTYLVKSGRGLHVYWVLTETIAEQHWRRIAHALKAACTLLGFRADPARTADSASILRPVGSTHRKGEPTPVRMLRLGEPYAPADVDKAIGDTLIAHGGTLPTLSTPPAVRLSVNDDLLTRPEFPPSSADKVASECGVVAYMRDNPASVAEPLWYGVLGVLAHTTEGDAVCHEWSKGHPGYTFRETARKLEQVRRFGPTSCDKLSGLENAGPICTACPHRGKITSPITLGAQWADEPVFAGPPTATLPGEDASKPRQVVMPYGFKWGRNQHGYSYLQFLAGPDDDGDEQWVPFCETLFYPINRIHERAEDRFSIEIEMQLKGGVYRRFLVKTSTVAEGGKALASELGRYEIVPLHPKLKPMIDKYLTNWIDQLRKSVDELITQNSFGWVDRDFLLGTRLITPTGDKPVVLRDTARKQAPAFEPKGTLETWKHVVNTAYNRPGQEAFQYLVMASLASPLLSMLDEQGGVTVYAHSEGSGAGKTTAMRAGLAAWGSWVDTQLANNEATPNAFFGLCGCYRNLPVMMDELTNLSNADASQITFSVSAGQAKWRSTKDGVPQKATSNWSLIMLANGNNLLSEKLSLHRSNAEAELARLFEFSVYSGGGLPANEANALFPLLKHNYGHAGEAFIRYVVNNYDAVRKAVFDVRAALTTETGATSVERYWTGLHASVLVALKISQKLGLVQFDTAAFKAWIIARMADNRTQMFDSVNCPTEQFGNMLADLWPGILVTEGLGDARSASTSPRIINEPTRALVGRAVLYPVPTSGKTNDKSALWINTAAIRDWCNKHGVSAKEMLRAGQQGGWISAASDRFSLGRGVDKFSSVSSAVRCWVVDPAVLSTETATTPYVKKLFTVINNEDDSVDAALSI